jgi:hypothetical protein
VVASAFAPFTYNQMGYGQAIATDTNYVKNTIIHAFHPGDYVLLWGTGLGPIAGSDAEAPPAGSLSIPITVYVGDTTATPSYQGRAPCCAGLDQIIFQVPTGVDGCYVPVGVGTGGAVGAITTIAVAASGSTCSDSILGQDLVNQLASGQKVDFGYIRLESLLGQLGFADYIKEDYGEATFSELDPGSAGLAQYGVSNGYCYVADTGPWINGVLSDSSPAQLDAGAALTLTGQTAVSVPQNYPGGGIYEESLDSENQTFLWGGNNFIVSGAGGANVGSFSVTDLTSSGTVKFSNIAYNQKLPRASDLLVQWTGGSGTLQNGQVTIGGYSFTSDYSQAAFFQCTAPFAAGQFTIPSWILSSLPPSGSGNNSGYVYALGWMWIGQYNKPTSFSATGLDRGIITDIFYNSEGVYFQ